MSAISELVDVKFVDNTNYANTSGNDVVGCVFDHCWGPVGKMVTYSQKDFFSQYPEGLPYGWNPKDSSRFYSYAQIKKVFGSAGSAGLVEAYRLRGYWKFFNFAVQKAEGGSVKVDESKFSALSEVDDRGYSTFVYNPKTYDGSKGGVYTDLQFPQAGENDIMQIALRYPGFFPYAGDFVAYKDFRLDVTVDTASSLNPIVVSLYGVSKYGTREVKVGSGDSGESYDEYTYLNDNVTLLERFYGSFDTTAKVDGASFYIMDVINSQSQYLRVNMVSNTFYGISSDHEYPETLRVYLNSKVNENSEFVPLLTYEDIYEEDGQAKDSVFTADSLSDYFEYIEDPETSVSTLFVAPIPFKITSYSKSEGTLIDDEATSAIFVRYASNMESRKDASFIWGYPTTETFDKEEIKVVGATSAAYSQSMFTPFYAGREFYYVYGLPIYLDCTAGIAGRTIAVAKSSHINQLASARQYGAYPGTLSESLSFTAVNDLHQNYNINSVYSTPNGNYIWGIKNNYPRMNSYYSKWNVARVINWLLKLTYPIILNAIHTETVSDDTTRLQFLSAINDVLRSLIPANIKEESTVRMETDDAKTRGGEEIILYYDIWFKKLAEHCTITIAATDSSVNVTVQ